MSNDRNFSTNRYFEAAFNTMAVKILPGEYHATCDGTVIVTVLGSCVAVCISDRLSGIGGMNHFMLPGKTSVGDAPRSARYGIHAMDLLVDHVISLGGKPSNLEAKVFGAGRVMNGMTDIGRRNAEFAIDYLAKRGISVSALDVGDVHPRKIIFFPATGKVFVRQIRTAPPGRVPAALKG